jgi:hypothetical protein
MGPSARRNPSLRWRRRLIRATAGPTDCRYVDEHAAHTAACAMASASRDTPMPTSSFASRTPLSDARHDVVGPRREASHQVQTACGARSSDSPGTLSTARSGSSDSPGALSTARSGPSDSPGTLSTTRSGTSNSPGTLFTDRSGPSDRQPRSAVAAVTVTGTRPIVLHTPFIRAGPRRLTCGKRTAAARPALRKLRLLRDIFAPRPEGATRKRRFAAGR